jgi:Flp pilus assembly protein TadG
MRMSFHFARIFKRRTTSDFAHDGSGAGAVEFALVAPVLLAIGFGALTFGLVMNNYVLVTNAASAGAKNLVLSRGAATPYSSTVNAIASAAPSLSSGAMTIVMTVNGAACDSDSTCKAALNAAIATPASVSVSYPCKLSVLGVNYAPNGCTLRQTTAGRIQ